MSVRVTKLEWSPSSPVTGELVTVSCNVVNEDVSMTVPVFCIAVRDPFGHRYDFPGPKAARLLTDQETEYISGARSFPVGEYRVFPAFRHPDGRWISLPSMLMFVSPK